LCNNPAVARLQLLLAAVLFGTTGTAQALAGTDSPVEVGAGRIAVGGAALLLIAVAGDSIRGLRPAIPLLLVGGVGVALYQLSFFAAVDRTGVTAGTVVAIGSAPVVTGILERIVEGTRPRRRWYLATALATAGVATLTVAAGGDATLSPVGIALALAAGAGYAVYTVIAKRLLRLGHDPIGVMAASFGTGAILLLPVLALGDRSWLAAPSGIVLVLYLGILPTALAYVLFARGLRRVSAAEATTLVLAEPVTAAVLGAAVLDERLGTGAALGAGLVLAGLLALAVPSGRRRASPVAVADA
jgi:DME family drug/metabolite transporter